MTPVTRLPSCSKAGIYKGVFQPSTLYLVYSATLGEMGRLNGEVVGSVVGGLKQPCVIGYSLGWELWRCAVPLLDSMLAILVESPLSPVFPSPSSTKRG